jgi:hypothetical protein
MSYATTLLEPDKDVIEGTCPSSSCGAVYALTASGQIPEHTRANRWARSRPGRCPCSGWLARDPHPRKYFYVEGVRFL